MLFYNLFKKAWKFYILNLEIFDRDYVSYSSAQYRKLESLGETQNPATKWAAYPTHRGEGGRAWHPFFRSTKNVQ